MVGDEQELVWPRCRRAVLDAVMALMGFYVEFAMWHIIAHYLPDSILLLYTLLSAVVPWLFFGCGGFLASAGADRRRGGVWQLFVDGPLARQFRLFLVCVLLSDYLAPFLPYGDVDRPWVAVADDLDLTVAQFLLISLLLSHSLRLVLLAHAALHAGAAVAHAVKVWILARLEPPRPDPRAQQGVEAAAAGRFWVAKLGLTFFSSENQLPSVLPWLLAFFCTFSGTHTLLTVLDAVFLRP